MANTGLADLSSRSDADFVEFLHSRAHLGHRTTRYRVHHREEFLFTKGTCTAENRIVADLDQLSYATYMVVMPMSGNYEVNHLRRI